MKLSRNTTRQESLHFLQENTGKILLALIVATYILFVPKVVVGTVFFGGVPSLYNIPFAKFFYRQSIIFDSTDGVPPVYAHYQLGRIYFIEGNLDRAIEELQTEIVYHPYNNKTYYMLGLTYGFKNNLQDAIESFKKYNDLHPETWAGKNDLAWLYFRAGNINDAYTTISSIVPQNTKNPWVLNTYGVILLNMNKLNDAKIVLTDGYTIAQAMSEKSWGMSYPGNDPRVYSTGLSAMRNSFRTNLNIVNKRLGVDK